MLQQSADKEPGELKLSCMLQQAITNYPYTFSHHTQKATNIDGFFLSLSNAPSFFMEKCASAQPNFITQCITHIELCHTTGDHFDCVLTLNDTPSTSHPQLDDSSSYINIG